MGLIEDFIAEHPKEMELAQMRRREVKKLLADYDKTLREQIAREIEAEAKRSELIEESRYSEEYESSRIASFNGGHIGGLTTAAAIARGEK